MILNVQELAVEEQLVFKGFQYDLCICHIGIIATVCFQQLSMGLFCSVSCSALGARTTDTG